MSTASTPKTPGKVERLIEERIQKAFNPEELKITNDSHLHRHHAPMQGVSSTETHFRVRIVSSAFAKKPMLMRHREIFRLLDDEMKRVGGIHALVLDTKTPEEVAAAAQKTHGSP
ncbi:bola domain-containing protein [Coemansia reversa NRRL 1564]|uniref:Bola domain-containing protein n=1 Tax=Coemansia reversa (strain ATCC 12441 / NRRL 1564) TaxID=763665 RepID=A0A2G5B7A3_COERN|nr:bola domain-containing protein [Coemansia reversa NRRL 1564]|eukprot:PIA14607.1 bola domain-containing protein [Coemansia reversa NRRL 1564]